MNWKFNIIIIIIFIGCTNNPEKSITSDISSNSIESTDNDCVEIEDETLYEDENYKILFTDEDNYKKDVKYQLSLDRVGNEEDFFQYILNVVLDDSKPISTIKPTIIKLFQYKSIDSLLTDYGYGHLEELTFEDEIYLILKKLNLIRRDFVKHEKERIVLSLENNKTKILNSEMSEDSVKTFYGFHRYLPSIDYYLISVNEKSYVNKEIGHTGRRGVSYLLINQKNGETTPIWDTPSISPDKDKIVVASFGWWEYAYAKVKGFQIFSISDESLKLESEFVVCNLEPRVIGWLGSSKLLIDKYNDSEDMMEMNLIKEKAK